MKREEREGGKRERENQRKRERGGFALKKVESFLYQIKCKEQDNSKRKPKKSHHRKKELGACNPRQVRINIDIGRYNTRNIIKHI